MKELSKFEEFELKVLKWIFKDSWWHIAGMLVIIIATVVVMAWYASAITIAVM